MIGLIFEFFKTLFTGASENTRANFDSLTKTSFELIDRLEKRLEVVEEEKKHYVEENKDINRRLSVVEKKEEECKEERLKIMEDIVFMKEEISKLTKSKQ